MGIQSPPGVLGLWVANKVVLDKGFDAHHV